MFSRFSHAIVCVHYFLPFYCETIFHCMDRTTFCIHQLIGIHVFPTILDSYQQCRRVSIFPYPCEYLLFSIFLMTSILGVVKWDLAVDLVCMSLKTNNVEYLLMSLLAICVYFKKGLSKFSAYFSVGLLCFLLLSCRSFIYIL